MKFNLFAMLIVVAVCVCSRSLPAQSYQLPRSTPESQGISSAAILEFIETADRDVNSMHSFMLVRHGNVIAEAWWAPEAADSQHVLWSLSKSFASTGVGFAVAEGKLSVDDPVLKFFPEEAPDNASENLKKMTVKHLLTMSAGHDTEASPWRERDWVQAFLAHPVPHEPGTRFMYNTPATYMLSAIVQKVTGETLLDYLKPRLFEKLKIENPRWDACPMGRSIGGFGLYLKTEDIAKFGQFYLQEGKWNGVQLLSKDWIAEATSKQISNGTDPNRDWTQGYGYQFWRSRHNAYRGDGKDGQFCVVLPDQDAVVAITANTGDMQAELNIVWEKLLPEFKDAALPEDSANAQKLAAKISQLKKRR